MKNSMQIFSHLIACIILGVFSIKLGCQPELVPSLFFSYITCLVICPVLALTDLKKFTIGLFIAACISTLLGSMFISLSSLNTVFTHVLLTLASVLFGTLLVSSALPKETKETRHFESRGLTKMHAKQKALLRQSFSLFFEKSGAIASAIGACTLFVASKESVDGIMGMAISIIIINLLGKLIYGLLCLPSSKTQFHSQKGRYKTISLLSFFVFMVSVYVYVGSLYTLPDPALKSALHVCKDILTPAFLSVVIALIGILFGLFLSLFSVRFFRSVFGFERLLSPPLLSALIYLLLKNDILYAQTISVSVPLFIFGMYTILNRKLYLIPYREFSLINRKKTLINPLVIKPIIGTIPVFITEAVFSSAFINIKLCDSLQSLSSLSQIYLAVILAFIFIISIVICILTKEVRQNG